MSSTSETGHVRNVANFQNIISFCTGYGAAYNPSNATLSLDSMQTILNNAKNAINDCKAKKTAYNNATDQRRDLFADLKSLGTKVLNAFAISGVADSAIESARSINRKLQGQRAGTIPDAPVVPNQEPAGSNNISVSQQSFDNQADHLASLISLVGSHTQYNPNEEELKTAGLEAYLAALLTANAGVIDANTALSNSRLSRDNILYLGTDNMVDVALRIKGYIKSAFGAASLQYIQVSGIEFKRE